MVAGYNNYDNCWFLDQKMAVSIDGKAMEKNQEDLNKIKAFLETSPDLSVYDYQEWDSSTENFVNEVIANSVPGGRMIANAENVNRKSVPETHAIITDIPVS